MPVTLVLSPHIKLNMILPCKNQAKGWAQKDSAIYEYILSHADEVVYVSEEYHSRCMLNRNDYMIAHSSHCIAYLKSQRGGTAYTVKKAQKDGLAVYNVAKDMDFFHWHKQDVMFNYIQAQKIAQGAENSLGYFAILCR